MNNGKHAAVCFGEILWDVLPSGEKPGGAPMNVAYHLQKLGLAPALISRVGNDPHGQRLIELLNSWKVNSDYVQLDHTHATGVVQATIGQNHEVTYDIVYPVAWDFIEWTMALQELVSQADYFISGSLASRAGVSRKTLYHLREAAKNIVLDINLRTPFYSDTAVADLLEGTSILKLNEHELPLIAGWFGKAATLADAIAIIQEKFRIPVIVVTMGGNGALVNANGVMFQHPGYKVSVADTVGSGDAFLAGFLYKYHHGAAIADCLTFANMLGAFVASSNGACPEYFVEEIVKMF